MHAAKVEGGRSRCLCVRACVLGEGKKIDLAELSCYWQGKEEGNGGNVSITGGRIKER